MNRLNIEERIRHYQDMRKSPVGQRLQKMAEMAEALDLTIEAVRDGNQTIAEQAAEVFRTSRAELEQLPDSPGKRNMLKAVSMVAPKPRNFKEG